jgi:hypothetical protein
VGFSLCGSRKDKQEGGRHERNPRNHTRVEAESEKRDKISSTRKIQEESRLLRYPRRWRETKSKDEKKREIGSTVDDGSVPFYFPDFQENAVRLYIRKEGTTTRGRYNVFY